MARRSEWPEQIIIGLREAGQPFWDATLTLNNYLVRENSNRDYVYN